MTLNQHILTEQNDQEIHCHKKLAVARTGDGRYLWAIYSETGFAVYRLSNQNESTKKKIRKTAREHGVDLPGRIIWDDLPFGQFIEKVDGEAEARIKDERMQHVRRVRDYDAMDGDEANDGTMLRVLG